MKNEKISRIEKGVFALIENKISEELNLLIKKFKENSEISGSRVLTTEIVKKTFEELNEEEEIEY